MGYPFLPVNSCCTDVVINNPCGCSSTTSNHSCNQNMCGTNVTLSSNVIYNGPALDCIIAEPCDTLNVVLQKIDEIICNLLAQINTLNIQVANIITQIININQEIININTTLDVCCTTTTTTVLPTTTTTTTIDFILKQGLISSEGSIDSIGACLFTPVNIIYVEGTNYRAFNDFALTSPFVGGDLYWAIKYDLEVSVYAMKIDNDGYILDVAGVCL